MARRGYEPGHRPKFLVVIDETPECERAIRFGARRAVRTGAGLVLVCVIAPLDAPPILGVADLMQAEAVEAATALLEKAAVKVRAVAGIEPELALLEGVTSDAVLDLIARDEDVAILVLAAGTGSDGPGPLISLLVGKASGSIPVPIAIVPGHLSDAEIEAVA